MKRRVLLGLIIVLALVFVGCQKDEDDTIINVGATPVPHSELLELVKDDLEEQGYTLEIVEFTDYITPNTSLADGAIDANFFQHKPYLDEFINEQNLDLTSIGTIHVEPLGLYSDKYEDITSLSDDAVIAIPSDSVNGGRALILLENNGLITLKEDAGLKATADDIIDNPKGFVFKSIEAAQLARVLPDVDAAVINGNYALEADLSPVGDALILEGAESPYANIIVTRTEDKDKEKLLALLEALQSDEVRSFIEATYGGAVVEAFDH